MTLVIIAIAAIAAYLLVGVVLCVEGKLATKIAYDVAITTTFKKLPARKVWVYRFLMRLGVMVAWPVFWFGS